MRRFWHIYVDWLPILSYAIHNVVFARAVMNRALFPAVYIERHYNIDPIMMVGFLMGGFLWMCCLFLSWRWRLVGMIPLVIVAITSIRIYHLILSPERALGTVWVYGLMILYPIGLAASIQDNKKRREEEQRLHIEAERLERLVKTQNETIIRYESRFGVLNGTE